MARRGGFGRSTSPPRASSPPRAAPPPPPPAAAAPRQPGMMAQIGATAAGVAVGSTVGHVVGHAITGSGSSSSAPQESNPGQQQYSSTQQQQEPCKFQIDRFMDCSMNQSDLNMCGGFMEAIKECRRMYAGQSASNY